MFLKRYHTLAPGFSGETSSGRRRSTRAKHRSIAIDSESDVNADDGMFDDDVNDPDYDIKLDVNDLKSLDILNDENEKEPAEETTTTEIENSKTRTQNEKKNETNCSDQEQDASEADMPTLDTQDSIAGVGEAVELVSDVDDDDFGDEENGLLALDEVDEELKKKLKKIKPSASNT